LLRGGILREKAKADKSLAVVLDQFMAEHIRLKLKPSTVEDYQRLARLYVKPLLRNRAVGELKRWDIARLHHGLSGKPYQANRVLAFLSVLFNWAEKHGLWPDGSNPCRHVEKYGKGRRERFLSQAEAGEARWRFAPGRARQELFPMDYRRDSPAYIHRGATKWNSDIALGAR
jgi:hypothetical protein